MLLLLQSLLKTYYNLKHSHVKVLILAIVKVLRDENSKKVCQPVSI